MVDIEQNTDEKKSDQSTRLPRDMRYRNELFPDADRLVFKTSEKGLFRSPSSCAKYSAF